MAITINWDTRVISVPKADLTLIQSTPTEIRELDINWFRLELKALEASETGQPFPDTHTHNTDVSLGGLTFARVVEIINGYTVTFEDGQYAVNLVGANHNVADVTNVNQVSVRTFLSAGLISSPDIEYSSYEGGVTIDITSSYTGTLHPVGTKRQPVNNLADAKLIATYRGLTRLFIIGDIGFTNTENVDNYQIVGENPRRSEITIGAGCSTEGTEFSNCTVVGTLDGNTWVTDCHVDALTYIHGRIIDSTLSSTMTLSGTDTVEIHNCIDGSAGLLNSPIIDMDGGNRDLIVANYTGVIVIRNLDTANDVGIGLNAGYVILDSTVTSGSIIISGIGVLIDNSTGTATVEDSGLLNSVTIASATWEDLLENHTEPGSIGAVQYPGFRRN